MTNRPAEVYRPKPYGLDKEFYEHATRTGVVHVQQCASCGSFQHPPRFVCASCAARELTWHPIEGIGTVYSWALSHFTIDAAWSESLPYATVVAAAVEGPRFVGTYSGPEDDLKIGLTVNIRCEQLDDDLAYIWFDPIPGTETHND